MAHDRIGAEGLHRVDEENTFSSKRTMFDDQAEQLAPSVIEEQVADGAEPLSRIRRHDRSADDIRCTFRHRSTSTLLSYLMTLQTHGPLQQEERHHPVETLSAGARIRAPIQLILEPGRPASVAS